MLLHSLFAPFQLLDVLPVISTRQIRCDYEFLGLLESDSGIDLFSLSNSYMGIPSAPKKVAIALC
jgi:hypothetical protein